jgi:hypothetical protein
LGGVVGWRHTDLTYEVPDVKDEGEIVDQIIEVLSADTGHAAGLGERP